MSEFNNDFLGSISVTSKNKMSGKVKVIGNREEELNTSIIIKRSNQINGYIGVYSDNIIDSSGKHGRQIKSHLSVSYRDQILSSISVKPRNRMRVIAEIIEPPTTKIKVNKIKESLVMSSNPTLNYSNTRNTLVGKKEQEEYRTLMKINLEDIPSKNQIITKSSLVLTKENYTTSEINIDIYELLEPWDPDGVTWLNQPKVGDKITSVAVGRDPGKVTLDILGLVNDWYSKTKENHGILLTMNSRTGARSISSDDVSLQFTTSKSGVNYPVVNIEYYDESATHSTGLTKLTSSISVRRSNLSSLPSSLFVNSDWSGSNLPGSIVVPQYYGDSDLNSKLTVKKESFSGLPTKLITSVPFIHGKIRVFNLNGIDSSITVRKMATSTLPSNLKVRRTKTSELRGSLEIKIKNANNNLDSSIIVSRPNLLSSLSAKVHDNLSSAISVRNNGELDIPSNITISRPFLIGKLKLTISNQLPSSIKVINDYIDASISVRRSNDTEIPSTLVVKAAEGSTLDSLIRVFETINLDSSIVVRKTIDKDLLSNITVVPHSTIPSSIKVINGSIDSSITIRRDGYNDLVGSITAKVLKVSELDTSINVFNTSDLNGTIQVFVPIINIPTSITVIKGSIDSSITIRRNGHEELISSIAARVLEDDDLSSTISILNLFELPSSITVAGDDQGEIYVFIL